METTNSLKNSIKTVSDHKDNMYRNSDKAVIDFHKQTSSISPLKVSIIKVMDSINESGIPGFIVKLSDENGNAAKTVTDIKVSFVFTGTAVNGDDYTSKSFLIIEAGTSYNALQILDDIELEGEILNHIEIEITEVKSKGIDDLTIDSLNSSLRVDITEHSCAYLSISEVKIDEKADLVEFTVNLYDINTSSEVAVDYLLGNMALINCESDSLIRSDALAKGTLIFEPGINTHTVTVSNIEKLCAGKLEEFNVVLTNAVNATIKVDQDINMVTNNTEVGSVLVSIVESEDTNLVKDNFKDSFKDEYQNIDESASFTVELRDIKGKLNTALTNVTIDVLYSGTAKNDTDFVGIASLTIPANTASFDFDIASLDNFIAETAEKVNIKLINPVGGGFEDIAIDNNKSTLDIRFLENC